jgi:hypothetical protein
MDLQSILNDSDSSSYDGVREAAVDYDDDCDGDSNYDIEEILREADDDDNISDFNATAEDMDGRLDLPISQYVPSERRGVSDTVQVNSDTKENGERATKYKVMPLSRGYVSSHNPEDWAVLQQIMNEDDDDDDDHEEEGAENGSMPYQSTPRLCMTSLAPT